MKNQTDTNNTTNKIDFGTGIAVAEKLRLNRSRKQEQYDRNPTPKTKADLERCENDLNGLLGAMISLLKKMIC
ncbi:MAG: hypothetical protein ACPG5B_17490 [Chitinophagales bacterium]